MNLREKPIENRIYKSGQKDPSVFLYFFFMRNGQKDSERPDGLSIIKYNKKINNPETSFMNSS
ncbi:hypothetical protein BpHYR1_009105 [Brachionus plicatilis]|uniref:Uncharacterized protein n=1 Tax=Brachionus plicatilis TaxID=10195 RepID=A0A3M7RJJ5_BRAPC|nr:hypothetical protein BpHYR1_009105 [Brachionus plicatilis]